MSTYSAKPADITRKFYLVDASDAPLGRIATKIAVLLTGKHKPSYTKHIDCGDYVVVVNAARLKVSGDKMDKKIYYKHTGFPGGINETKLSKKLDKDSSEVILHSVRGMLPTDKLRDGRLKRLKIYNDEQHKQQAQKPEKIDLRGSQ